MLSDLYCPGASPLHRLAAGVKLAVLVAAGVVVFAVHEPATLAATLFAALGLAGLARLPFAALLRRLVPFLVLVAVFLAVHVLLGTTATGLVVVARFATMIVLGLVVAMTTRLSELVAALERALAPLRLVGIDPQKAGLVLSMTIRFVPLAAETWAEISAAQQARGLERNVLARLVPLLVRLLERAEEIADALTARGADD